MDATPGTINGHDLRDLRKLAKLSQEKLGEFLNRSRETISAIENNHPEAIGAMTSDFVAEWTKVCYLQAEKNGKKEKAKEKKQSIISTILRMFEG